MWIFKEILIFKAKNNTTTNKSLIFLLPVGFLQKNYHSKISDLFVFVLFVALKKRISSKIYIVSCFLWLKSVIFNFMCVFKCWVKLQLGCTALTMTKKQKTKIQCDFGFCTISSLVINMQIKFYALPTQINNKPRFLFHLHNMHSTCTIPHWTAPL